jgi:sugar lactone lactonase YvrE
MNRNDELVEQEIPYSGVYMIRAADIWASLESGIPTPKVTLLDNKLSRPNGIGFSPDFSKLYVANSDENNPIWKVYDINDDGTVKNERIFFNATDIMIQDKEKNILFKRL